jgi:hypothetical protein
MVSSCVSLGSKQIPQSVLRLPGPCAREQSACRNESRVYVLLMKWWVVLFEVFKLMEGNGWKDGYWKIGGRS